MIGGATPVFWLSFHAAVLLILLIDLIWLQRSKHQTSSALAWTATLIGLSLGFAGYLYWHSGTQPALEFISGYAIEFSLSVDNLFVFMLLFSNFQLDIEQQRSALGWGVLGAIILRGVFIFAGVALLQRFAYVEFLFGAILLVAAFRLLFQKQTRQSSPVWIRTLITSSSGEIRKPVFLMAIVAIEVTDLVFALDSVPAVIAISRQPFIIYTSNICAILGLRSLYFVLSSLLGKLRLLHYGLGLILAFVGAKMILERWVTIPITVSLSIILGILCLFTLLSWMKPRQVASHLP